MKRIGLCKCIGAPFDYTFAAFAVDDGTIIVVGPGGTWRGTPELFNKHFIPIPANHGQ